MILELVRALYLPILFEMKYHWKVMVSQKEMSAVFSIEVRVVVLAGIDQILLLEYQRKGRQVVLRIQAITLVVTLAFKALLLVTFQDWNLIMQNIYHLDLIKDSNCIMIRDLKVVVRESLKKKMDFKR